MRISWLSGIPTPQGNRTMTKNLALAASITMLVALSGQAFAAAPHARYWPEATGRSDRQMDRAFNAFDSTMATQTAEPNAYRYHGGPKTND
jgi:hypothetical protein